MRLILVCVTTLLIMIQYPLWLGKGGWLHVWDLDQQVNQAHMKSDELKARNAKLDSEVQDLKQGTEAIEERARYELGMIKNDELFVQVLQNGEKSASGYGASMVPEKVADGDPLRNREATLEQSSSKKHPGPGSAEKPASPAPRPSHGIAPTADTARQKH